MEPISMIVLAVVKGAAASVARNAANDGYRLLRGMIVQRYGPDAEASLAQVERAPGSEQARSQLEHRLRDLGAERDPELASLARQVLDMVDGAPVRAGGAEQLYRTRGVDALTGLLGAHVDRVAAVRAARRVDDADLLAGGVTGNRNLPAEIQRSAGELHTRFRRVVEQVAQRIEDGRYREVESAVAAIDGSRQVREQARELVAADKHMHVSYETLRLTVEFFGDLNQAILTRLTTERPSPAQLSNIMFTNAVMIYEITDFVIDYVQSFAMDSPHEALHRAAADRAQQNRRAEAALQEELDAPGILPEARESMLEEVHQRITALDELDRQWERYLEEIRGLHTLVDEVKRTVPTLRAIRTNARNQINVLQEAAMLRVLTMNSRSMRGAVEAVQSLRLAPLSSERVRVLVGAVD